MAEEVDDQNEYEKEDRADEFLSPLESDPSKAELMCICQRLNQLLITLRCKKDELAIIESEITRGQFGLKF